MTRAKLGWFPFVLALALAAGNVAAHAQDDPDATAQRLEDLQARYDALRARESELAADVLIAAHNLDIDQRARDLEARLRVIEPEMTRLRSLWREQADAGLADASAAVADLIGVFSSRVPSRYFERELMLALKGVPEDEHEAIWEANGALRGEYSRRTAAETEAFSTRLAVLRIEASATVALREAELTNAYVAVAAMQLDLVKIKSRFSVAAALVREVAAPINGNLRGRDLRRHLDSIDSALKRGNADHAERLLVGVETIIRPLEDFEHAPLLAELRVKIDALARQAGSVIGAYYAAALTCQHTFDLAVRDPCEQLERDSACRRIEWLAEQAAWDAELTVRELAGE